MSACTYSTIDEINFLRKMACGEIQLIDHHWVSKVSADIKIENYINAMPLRKNWGKINPHQIEKVCNILRERMMNEELIEDHYTLDKMTL